MTWNVATDTEPVARKSYRCDACDCFHSIAEKSDLTPEEEAVYEKAAADGFKIPKGTKYFKTSSFWDGEPSVFRARPDMDAICQKYDLYDA